MTIGQKLIIAPIGLQPAAVVAPLLSPPVQPASGDSVLLLASSESESFAQSIADLVFKSTGVETKTEHAHLGELQKPLLEIISAAAATTLASGGEIVFLVNGGDGIWLHQILDVLLGLAAGKEKRIALASSTALETKGTLFRLDGTTEAFDILDLQKDTLLRLLGLDLTHGNLRLRAAHGQPALEIEGIAENGIRACQGSLFAVIDVSMWPVGNQIRLNRYRRLLRYGFLQNFGLERRRIFLRLPPDNYRNTLGRRARGDSIVTDFDGLTFEEWFASQKKRPRAAATVPLRLPPDLKRAIDRAFGSTLVIILGPNPGPTIQAIASHGSHHVVALCDETSAEVVDAAWRFAALHREMLPSQSIEFVKMGGFEGRLNSLRELLEHRRFRVPLDVNLTPGEKLRRLFLQCWARKSSQRKLWVLDRASVLPFGGGTALTANIPLRTWIGLHTKEALRATSPHWFAGGSLVPEKVVSLARDISQHLLSPGIFPRLDALWLEAKRANLRLTGMGTPPPGDRISWPAPVPGVIVVPGGRGRRESRYSLAELKSLAQCDAVHEAFLPLERTRGGVDLVGNGRWFEWVVGALLAAAEVQEVQLGIKIGPVGGTFSNEMDVVTAHEGAYALWSCKTTRDPGKINSEARAASGTAQRFLGRAAWCVVVVPRIEEPAQGWMHTGTGQWRVSEKTQVVDLSFFSDNKAVQELAARGAGRSR